jgi:hypothetical protein
MDDTRFNSLLEEGNETRDFKAEGCPFLGGLQIMAKYLPAQRLLEAAEHDIVYGPNRATLITAGITEDDVRALGRLGWFSDEVDGVAHHV